MREAIGGTWLFGLVITFIVFFASFLAISINYSKAFNVKNGVVDRLSKYEGNNTTSREKISDYLYKEGYMVQYRCNTDKEIQEDSNNNPSQKGKDLYKPYVLGNTTSLNYDQKGNYCIKEVDATGSSPIIKKYYQIKVFFRIDLPLVGVITTFPVKGETETVFYSFDN